MLSICIPARNEEYLSRTILDLKEKAEGAIEIITVLDGADAPRLDGVTYIYHPVSKGMRESINAGVEASSGEYIMKIDAHCIVAKGFDTQLIADHQDNWIQIPRRYKLDEARWSPDFTSFNDYEYYIYPKKHKAPSLHGYKWRARTEERKDILLDDTLTFQGSFWFMTRAHWNKHNFMKDEGYNTIPSQEATYIGSTTWLTGGRVVVNKATWYAHLHKTKEKGRGYPMDRKERRECCDYSYNHWVNENKEGFIKLIEKFSPLPNWPRDWQTRLYED